MNKTIFIFFSLFISQIIFANFSGRAFFTCINFAKSAMGRSAKGAIERIIQDIILKDDSSRKRKGILIVKGNEGNKDNAVANFLSDQEKADLDYIFQAVLKKDLSYDDFFSFSHNEKDKKEIIEFFSSLFYGLYGQEGRKEFYKLYISSLITEQKSDEIRLRLSSGNILKYYWNSILEDDQFFNQWVYFKSKSLKIIWPKNEDGHLDKTLDKNFVYHSLLRDLFSLYYYNFISKEDLFKQLESITEIYLSIDEFENSINVEGILAGLKKLKRDNNQLKERMKNHLRIIPEIIDNSLKEKR